MKRLILISVFVAAATSVGHAKMDLATLPSRDAVQVTIYNSADMTLVRERRDLTVKQGENKLQFSWADTLIDPTSLEMLPKANADQINIADLTFPPRVKNLGLWNVTSKTTGPVPVEISYLTSGLTWRAFYMGTLSENEETMRLQAYVRVSNRSGEDYENAQTRLIVGKVHILDQIAELARREHPYGRPGEFIAQAGSEPGAAKDELKRLDRRMGRALRRSRRRKEIVKEGLSEYFLYTIEGKETIADGWSKRLMSFEKDAVPVVNLYKYEQDRYGDSVRRFISFKNDDEHQLGETPIPGGLLKVYRGVDEAQRLAYVGQSSFKYIPVDEDVELNLAPVADVVVKPTLMNFVTENYRYDRNRDIDGWDEIRSFKVEVKNTRHIDAKVEIKRNFGTQYWDIASSGQTGEFEIVDLDTVEFTLVLEPRSEMTFEYVLRTYHGTRVEDWKPRD
jgi:hypothetical protein